MLGKKKRKIFGKIRDKWSNQALPFASYDHIGDPMSNNGQ